ncbi:MAG TPA: hypothetical protein VMU99_01575 [Acidimicrobiales bacterium]|nr:hypothetical protein [Acidimicrobiales bacterium]
MNFKNTSKGELGSILVKTFATTVLGGLFGAHEAESSSTSAASSAWKEIESKLHGLFGAEEKKKEDRFEGKHFVKIVAVVAALLVISYLLGRRQGGSRATVLEVHKA